MTTWLGNIRRRADTGTIADVIDGGFCVGCGVCAFVAPDDFRMVTAEGARQAVMKGSSRSSEVACRVCPFHDAAPDEDEHTERLFADAPVLDSNLGAVREALAGHVSDSQNREHSSSGGLATWFLGEVLTRGLVDAVIHVHPVQGKSEVFSYAISRTPSDVRRGAKTRYYSVSLEKVLSDPSLHEARIAVVAVPCYIKALRNLALVDPEFAKRFALGVSLVCGHMKSRYFADSLSWQSGVDPSSLETVDFRSKIPGKPASHYAVKVAGQDDEVRTRPMREMAGHAWDGGYFKLQACEFCDDVVGETADISFGDAWLPRFEADSFGNSIVVIRDAQLVEIFGSARADGTLSLEKIEVDEVVASQAAGFRDRREGLAYRLWLADKRGQWRPRKRVSPEREHITRVRRLIIRVRMRVRRTSFATYRVARRTHVLVLYTWPMRLAHILLRSLQRLERWVSP